MVKKKKLWESPKFTKKDLKEFKKEIARKPDDVKLSELSAIFKKEVKDLSDSEKEIIKYKMGYLSDEERYKFRNILVIENLTEDEKTRYTRIYPNQSLFDRYFPTKDNVEEHYKTYFLNR